LPESAALPALGFFTRGGSANPHIKGIVEPSIQFDCWAKDEAAKNGPIGAREVYRALYGVLQGIQNQAVTVDGSDYLILSAIEEVQGQDLQDMSIPGYYRVLTFFKFIIRAE